MTFTFNFNAEELKNNTTADKEANGKRGGKFFNQNGEYDVTLSVVKAEPKAAPNAHWVGVQLECKDADERAIKFFIDFPITSVLTNEVNGKSVYYAYSSLKRFLVGCGLAENVGDIKSENIMEYVPMVFADPEATLNGQEAVVTCKWKKDTVHIELREGYFLLVDHEGNPVETVEKLKAQSRDESGNIIEDEDSYSFADARTTLEAMAEDEGLRYKGFIDATAIKLKNPITKQESNSLF